MGALDPSADTARTGRGRSASRSGASSQFFGRLEQDRGPGSGYATVIPHQGLKRPPLRTRRSPTSAAYGLTSVSPREIADLAGLPFRSIRMMLTRMVKAGEIMRKGRGGYIAKRKPACDNGYKSFNGSADEAAL